MGAILKPLPEAVVYPSSDGKRMAENTRQYEWIVTIKGNLDTICVGERAAFVAGDNLIYPVEGDSSICVAPDVYVAFGRPREHRGSYQVWLEDNVFPQVIFEILSPSNTHREMDAKRQFYRTYGAEEYYVYDPDRVVLQGWMRTGRRFVPVSEMHRHVSPRLGIRFDMAGVELEISGPDGKPFLSFAELVKSAAQDRKRADAEHKRAEQERKRAEQERTRAEAEQSRAELERTRAETAETQLAKQNREVEQLREKLRSLGIDPNNS